MVSPLNWAPLPIPLSPIYLHVAVIAADIALIVCGIVFLGFAAVLLALASEFISDPVGTSYSLMRSTGELGAFAAMMKPYFGL